MKLLKNSAFLLLILILFAVFWVWWIPGSRVANDFSFISSDWLRLQSNVPQAWNERGAEGLGEYGVFTLWSYPVNFIFGVLTYIGLNFEIWERVLILLFIFLGSISIWKFLSNLGLSNKSKLIGSIFYLANTYSFLLIDGGQISIALAYGLFPYVLLRVYQSVQQNLREKILAGLLVCILGFFDIRFLFILLLFLLLKALFDIWDTKEAKLKLLASWVKTGLVIGLIVLAINSFWLLAQINNPLEKEVLESITKISTNFLNLGHPILVISPHWYKNIFGQISQLKAEFIFLPLLAFLAPILKRKDKGILFWVLTALISIFLAKGGAEPLSQIYPWLHANIPGFYFFRDSTKFFFLLILSYSVLISFTSEIIFKKLSKYKLSAVYLAGFVFYLLFLIRPIFLNQMTGTFSIQPFEKEFKTLDKVLKEDKSFGRVFWIPATAPLAYSDLNHPIVEAARIFNKEPFVFGIKGTYETFNFLREAPYMGEIFDIAGISYIAYPYLDPRRDDLKNTKYLNIFLKQLSDLPWIEKLESRSKVPLLKTKNHQDKIFITDNTWISFGTDRIFNQATESAGLRLSKNAVIFAEEKTGLGELIAKFPEAKIDLGSKTQIDLLATFIPQSKMIFPAKLLSKDPNKSGWWKNDGKNLISWRDFLQTKYNIDSKEFDLGGGWAIGEGNRQFSIFSFQFSKGKLLLARIMESSRSGNIKFYQDDQKIGEISTKTGGTTSVRWFEIGSLQSNGNLNLKTTGDINVINALAVVDLKDLIAFKQKANFLSKQITEFKPEAVVKKDTSISFEKINQTKYKIIVSNLISPQMLVFSAAYHPLWKISSGRSIPVYGFLNGFRVEKDGDYILEFEPQKDIERGLIVTLVSAIFLIGFLKLRRPNN